MTRPWLAPLNPLYRAGLAVKNHLHATGRFPVETLTSPVISVGSLSAGGAGKTPAVLALAKLLLHSGFAVDVLSRGYGRASKTVARVDPAGPANEFGDEPLELARAGLSVFVASERYRAGLLAEERNPDTIHLLDDGFQHRRLTRAFDIALVTLADLSDCLIPAGDLREPLASLRRADAVLLREEEAETLCPIVSRHTDALQWKLRRTVAIPPEATSRPFVFTGIARPESVLATIPRPAGHLVFPDHHPYSLADCDRLVAAARRVDANGFITTAKDAVKLTSAHYARLATIGPAVTATLVTTFLDERKILAGLNKVLPVLS